MKLRKLTISQKKALDPVKKFYGSLTDLFSDKRATHTLHKQKEFVAIPMTSYIMNRLAEIRKTFPDKKEFVDVGCGKGNILYLANYLGFNVGGIEFRKEYKEYHSFYDVFYGRAEEFKNYHTEDVIYLYRPMKDQKDMDNLMDIIFKKAKIGAIFIMCGYSSPSDMLSKYNIERIGDTSDVFIKTEKNEQKHVQSKNRT